MSDEPKRLRVSLSNVRAGFVLDFELNGTTGLLLVVPEPEGMRYQLIEVGAELDALQPAIVEQIYRHIESAAAELIAKHHAEKFAEQELSRAAKGQA